MGVHTNAVTVNKSGRRPRNVRISRKVKAAVELMVYDALSRKDAANKAGLTDHALYCALRKPHVIAFRKQCFEDLRGSEGARSLRRVAKLAESARAESVKLDANKFLLGLNGVSPVQRSEAHVTADVKVTPGYVIDLSAARDVTPPADHKQIDDLANEDGKAADSLADVPADEKGTAESDGG